MRNTLFDTSCGLQCIRVTGLGAGHPPGVCHIPMADPFDGETRELVLEAAQATDVTSREIARAHSYCSVDKSTQLLFS